MNKFFLFIIILFLFCNKQKKQEIKSDLPEVLIRFENLFLDHDYTKQENHYQEIFPGIYWSKREIPNFHEKFSNEINSQAINLIVIDMKQRQLKVGILGDDNKIQSLAKTSEIALEKNALVAVNGGFFSPPHFSYSHTIINGKVISYNSRERGVLGITGAHDFIIKKILPKQSMSDVKYAIGGWGILMREGIPVFQKNDSIPTALNETAYERHPRTIVGYSKDKQYFYFLTIDGRQAGYSLGLGLNDAAELVRILGFYEALNLDGGGSTTLYIKGKGIVNSPSDVNGEREILSILYAI